MRIKKAEQAAKAVLEVLSSIDEKMLEAESWVLFQKLIILLSISNYGVSHYATENWPKVIGDFYFSGRRFVSKTSRQEKIFLKLFAIVNQLSYLYGSEKSLLLIVNELKAKRNWLIRKQSDILYHIIGSGLEQLLYLEVDLYTQRLRMCDCWQDNVLEMEVSSEISADRILSIIKLFYIQQGFEVRLTTDRNLEACKGGEFHFPMVTLINGSANNVALISIFKVDENC